jgi:predicted DNA-binding antitoxin AbrB/MazE fold protein
MRQAIKTLTTLTRAKPRLRGRRGDIMRTIRVTFSHGVFKPLEKVSYPEGEQLTISIETQKEKEREEAKKEFFDWVDGIHEHNKDVDPEILEKEIEEAIQAVRKSKVKATV